MARLDPDEHQQLHTQYAPRCALGPIAPYAVGCAAPICTDTARHDCSAQHTVVGCHNYILGGDGYAVGFRDRMRLGAAQPTRQPNSDSHADTAADDTLAHRAARPVASEAASQKRRGVPSKTGKGCPNHRPEIKAEPYNHRPKLKAEPAAARRQEPAAAHDTQARVASTLESSHRAAHLGTADSARPLSGANVPQRKRVSFVEHAKFVAAADHGEQSWNKDHGRDKDTQVSMACMCVHNCVRIAY